LHILLFNLTKSTWSFSKSFLSQPDTNEKQIEKKDKSISLREENRKAHLPFQEGELLNINHKSFCSPGPEVK